MLFTRLFFWSSFLLWLFSVPVISGFDDLFDDIKQESEKASVLETRELVDLEFENVEEEIFYAILQENLVESAAKKLRDVQNKMLLMDDALKLPGATGQKYQEQQKSLSAYQTVLAERFIDGVLNSNSNLTVNVGANLNPFPSPLSSQDTLNAQAKELYYQLPAKSRAEFLTSWQASLTDGRARQLFAPYVGMALLYGVDEPLVAKAAATLAPFRQEFTDKKKLAVDQPLPKQEEADYVFCVMSRYERLLPLSARNNLLRIRHLEEQIRLKNTSPELYRLGLQSLEFEKETFLKVMKREGFDVEQILANSVASSASSAASTMVTSFDAAFLSWFRAKQKNQTSLLWPLEETGVVVQTFRPDEPESGIVLKTSLRHFLRASADGTFLRLSEKRYALQTEGLVLIFSASLEPLIADQAKVKRGDRLAIINAPFELRVIASEGRERFFDFLTLF